MSKKEAQKKSWFKGLKAEFRKIIWPDKETLAKQTAAVVSVSVVLGAIIAVIDFLVQIRSGFIGKITDKLHARKVILCQRQNGTWFIPIPGMRTK